MIQDAQHIEGQFYPYPIMCNSQSTYQSSRNVKSQMSAILERGSSHTVSNFIFISQHICLLFLSFFPFLPFFKRRSQDMSFSQEQNSWKIRWEETDFSYAHLFIFLFHCSSQIRWLRFRLANCHPIFCACRIG